ncbi:MAG: coiled-coil domain-containing protein, partial [Actinomycetota bacterium]
MTVRKRRIQSALALVLMVGLATLPTYAGAQSTAEKLEAAEARYSQLKEEANEATARYNDAYGALQATLEEIAATQRALDDARKRISGLQEQLDARARAAYQLGSTSTWDVLLEAQDLSEFSDRLVYLDRIAQDDADLATRVAVISEELRRHETNLARLEEEQRVLAEEAEREKNVVYEKLAEAEALREEYELELEQEQAAALAAAGAGGAAPGQIQTVAGAGLQA